MIVGDLLVVVYTCLILAYDISFADQFPLFVEQWKNQKACQFAGYILSLSVSLSLFSRMVLMLKGMLAVYDPFHVDDILRKYFFIFDLYWIVSIIISIVRSFKVLPDNFLCLYFSSKLHGWQDTSIFIILSSLELVVFLTTITLSERTIHYLKQSAKRAGRELTNSDRAVVGRCILVNFCNVFLFATMYLPMILRYVTSTSLYIKKWFTTVFIPINALLNLALYTMSTSSFRQCFCRWLARAHIIKVPRNT